MISQERFKGTLAIILASLLWGTTGTAASYAPDISPLAIGAFAMGIGGVLMLCTALKSLRQDYKKLFLKRRLVLLGALCVAIYPLAFYTSMRLSGVAMGTVVSIASAPLFAVILERLFSQKIISLQWLISFLFGAIGIVLLAFGKVVVVDTESDMFTHYLGIFMGLIAGVTYAGYSYVAKQLIDSGVYSKSAVAGLFCCAAMVLLPSLYFTGDNLFSTVTNLSVSLYMALVPMFLGYLLFGFGLRVIDASHATLITLIEPIIATLLAVLLLGEEFKTIGWLGMAMVGICLILQPLKLKSESDRTKKVVCLGRKNDEKTVSRKV